MKIEITSEIDVISLGNDIYGLPKAWQISVLVELLKCVDSETARRAIDRWEDE